MHSLFSSYNEVNVQQNNVCVVGIK